MSDEIENLLAAYLDDELPPEGRRSVEAILSADPSAVEALRSLAAVRDVVAALPHPPGPDLAPAVLRRIAPVSARLSLYGVALRAAAVALVAVTAGLVAAPSLRPWGPAAPAASAPAALPDDVRVVDAPAPPPPIPSPVVEAIGPPVEAARTAAVPPTAAPTIGPLPDVSGPTRLFLVNAQDEQMAEREAAAVLAISSRREFHRLDVPRESDGRPESVVFAAELDPSELSTLRTRLSSTFPGNLDEVDTAPTLVADLAREGRATTFRGSPAGDVLVPRAELAIRRPAVGPRDAGREPAEPPRERPEGGTEAADDPATRLDGPSVVLIWIVPAGE